MIITRTPLRISFFGGGTDFPKWYQNFSTGSVISTTINKYNFVNVRYLPPYFKYKNIIRYYKREEVSNINLIKHPSVRECLKFMKIKKGIEVVHHGDVPALSGLGSSSSFTVGLLNALHSLEGINLSKKELANLAIYIEQNKIKESVGSQDQTASAFGGFNYIRFMKNNIIEVNPISLKVDDLRRLESNLFLIFTDFQRKAEKIEKNKITNFDNSISTFDKINEITKEAYKLISGKKKYFDEFGELMNEQWKIKKTLSKMVTNNTLDKIYLNALNNGAKGGKLLGAGGGGFFLFYVKKRDQKKFLDFHKKYLIVPFKFDFTGSQIVYYSNS